LDDQFNLSLMPRGRTALRAVWAGLLAWRSVMRLVLSAVTYSS